jgi:hypothetical protein
VDILDVQWSNTGNKVQLGMAQVRVKIADLRMSNSSGAAPTAQKNKSASFYTLTQAVYVALHGWIAGSYYSALIRTAERRVLRDDGIKEHHMIFTVEVKDVSGKPVMTTLAAALINPELTKLS